MENSGGDLGVGCPDIFEARLWIMCAILGFGFMDGGLEVGALCGWCTLPPGLLVMMGPSAKISKYLQLSML